MSDTKRIFNKVKKEIIHYSSIALKRVATNACNQLIDVTSDEYREKNQTANFQLSTVTDALKTGLMETGQELVEIGRERAEERVLKQNPEMSDESKTTIKSAGEN
ncbi:hypothetical protein D8M04_18905 [Oceanobacillus piezotolerans]|uniref:Uncharacterized protein n=1 Tax=Oceanobacillus piezotolerans TaxID=2448030 RepID=A0A498DHU8_9BACI|nr:hypothetical protein [Oceanobacillus piezotolerans]RLL40616.1 hypothetical protein D8M04_18905 [Oceanobacillus piezotolerans]